LKFFDRSVSVTVKRSIALVIENQTEEGVRWLLVRRPSDDHDLPNIWGLPAGSYGEGETEEALVARIGHDKLGVELSSSIELLAEGSDSRTGGELVMRLYSAGIVSGQPEVPQAIGGVTQYTEWAWGLPEDLAHGASCGSLCCELGLDLVSGTDGT
jgi:ADP-ribose pyrophosphatase YjhB (NUDIX family)|tara:strand:- start:283 stop:750 length:468 start_codon:yes stop_codon:yes gene_type:complete